ncbi:phospholipase [Pseudomonas sp. HMWF021]|uniref:phospholipase n=1 Tax=Pseudomonas sp. HMWF021 TaxID=2056857 RepID=UPI000D36E5A1|nr:phospholipase [Pseudomonas sp. HMWF021]PTT32053.1 phospholipase [Pseudomonas sp. HMWF021]
MSEQRNIFDTRNWMSNVPGIGRLKLAEIVWPGAHNAGMDRKAPDHGVLVGHWVSCQSDTFFWQLNRGVRALDIRLIDDKASSPPLCFHHDGQRSGRTLDDLIEAVCAFLDDHRDEFILLDFHQLGYGSATFDYLKFRDLLLTRLGDRAIPRSDHHKTLDQLKATSGKQRVILAVPARRELDDDCFWESVRHRWSKKSIIDTDQLEQFIVDTLPRHNDGTRLWSLSATAYSLLGGPRRIHTFINDRFANSGDWIGRCCIISVDFFEACDIVRYCSVASRMKAIDKAAAYAPRVVH